MRVTTVGVVGAGAMGSGIAALAASAGCRVVLLDIPGDADPASPNRSAPARNGLAKAMKSKPASFMDAASTRRVVTGNTEDHLGLLADCDWIVEAIIELPEPKQQLFAKIESLMKPTAIIASNTSGIPMSTLLYGRSEKFRRRFLGTHFFNPPRYMHLLEVIPTPETDPAVIGALREFAERTMGKGIVIAKDVPGFIANRLGVYGMVATMRRMEQHGLTLDEVDGLTGVLIGRARSATFRTGDLSGLDVLAHVTKGIGDATGEDFGLPAWMLDLVAQGKLGDKTGGGFYTKTKEGTLTYDWKNRGTSRSNDSKAATLDKRFACPLHNAFQPPRPWAAHTVRSFAITCSMPRTTRLRSPRNSPTTSSPLIGRWSGVTDGKRDRFR